MIQSISGAEFKAIRELCGYSAREVAEFLAVRGTRASTVRSIYRIEEAAEVPWRYTEALQAMVGRGLFDQSLREIRRRSGAALPPESDKQHGGRSRRGGPSKRGAGTRRADDEWSIGEDRFVSFLNALPLTGNTVGWITAFRDGLRDLLGDVDRVVINVNIDCDIDNPERYEVDQIMTEHIRGTAEPEGNFEFSGREQGPQEPWRRLLEGFRRQGYPLERYRPPQAYDYYLGRQAYLGTVFLWRELGNAPITEKTLSLMTTLEPFFRFMLSDLVARSRQNKPQDRAFNDALSFMVRSAGLSDQERRVVMLQLFGHSYEQIADKLHLSLDAVRKHVKNIYRKTATHSYIELFAKYFTPRLGF